MTVRAGMVVTGTEVLTGVVADRNGPYVSERLAELGVELVHLCVCADRPADMRAQLDFLAGEGVELIVTSGGLGPTADDLTIEVVAEFAGRGLVRDAEVEARIEAVMRRYAAARPELELDPEALERSWRKQAMVPGGATVLDPVGTAPGVVVGGDRDAPAVVVLPGPPSELQAMWPAAVASEPFRAATAGAEVRDRTTLRLFGPPESEIAETLLVAEREVEGFDRLELTTCLRRGELEVIVEHDRADAGAARALAAVVARRHGPTLFASDGSTVDELVGRLLAGRTLALAESCTAGLLAARIAERPGASEYLAGGVVTYADEAKVTQLGVAPDLIERHGAVSEEVAEAMAAGALERFGADVAVSVTGIAGPGGGTDAKPVGTVCWGVATRDGPGLTRRTLVPGDRSEVRDRSTTVALHLLRRVLTVDAGPDE